MSTVADKLAPRLARPVFSFEIPDGDRAWETDPHKFEMQQLTLLQELDAQRAADASAPMSYVYAQIERALVSIDGVPVDPAKPLLDNLSPQVRKLMIVAFDHICAPKVTVKDFFGAMKTRIE